MTQNNGPEDRDPEELEPEVLNQYLEEELEGENPFLKDKTDEFLLEHARRTGDRELIGKSARREKKKRTIGGGRIYAMFVIPVVHHYRRGMDALIEIHTQISRWEREPGWVKPDWPFLQQRPQAKREIEDYIKYNPKAPGEPERSYIEQVAQTLNMPPDTVRLILGAPRIGMTFPGMEYPGTGWERVSPFRGLEDPRIASKLNFANHELFEMQKILARVPQQPELRGIIPITGWFAERVRDPLTGEIWLDSTRWVYGALDEIEWHIEMLDMAYTSMTEYLEALPGLDYPDFPRP